MSHAVAVHSRVGRDFALFEQFLCGALVAVPTNAVQGNERAIGGGYSTTLLKLLTNFTEQSPEILR